MKQIILILAILFFRTNCIAEVFIVNAENQTIEISKSEIREILLGTQLLWSTDDHIAIGEYNAANPLRIMISRKYLNMEPRQVYMTWMRLSLSGKTAPPKTFRTEQEVKDFVAQNPEAIGYISSAEKLPPEIKTLTIK